MIFKILVLILVLVLQDGFFCMKIEPSMGVYDRQEDLPVEFLFWSNAEVSTADGKWEFDWTTWSWKWVTSQSNSDPLALRFDSSVDASFDKILAKDFKTAGKTKIIIHGWTENGKIDWVQRMKNAYHDTDPNLNIFSVEWSQLAPFADYQFSARNTQKVGKLVAKFINYMIGRTETSFTLNDFHIVGFSLGAQVAGKAGAILNGKIARITGVDPAGWEFQGKPKNERLDSSDGVFVDVIHTESNPDELGDCDFWPNGGHSPMPGTEHAVWPSSSETLSHLRAYEYFIESITNRTGFRARKAASYDDYKTSGGCTGAEKMMGEAATSDGPGGNYYLETNAVAPYAKGQTC